MDDDLKHLLKAMREENVATRQENATAHQETRRHFDVAVEQIEARFDFLAETVQHVSEELQRTRVSLEGKIEQSAGSTRHFPGRGTARARRNRRGPADAPPAH